MSTPKPLPHTPTMQEVLREIAAVFDRTKPGDRFAPLFRERAASIERDSQGEKSLDLERLGKELYELRDKEAAPAAEREKVKHTVDCASMQNRLTLKPPACDCGAASPPPEHGRLEPGQWVHCSPELLNAGVSCVNTPRRSCQCEGGGSHDHFIAFRCRAPLTSPPASTTGGQARDWTQEHLNLAEKIMLFLGWGVQATKEPGFDSMRDRVCAMIAEYSEGFESAYGDILDLNCEGQDRELALRRKLEAAEASLSTLPARYTELQGVVALAQDGNRPLPFDRDTAGRMVREAWVRWAQTQPNPKPSWLVPYDELSEPDKEADRQIGETLGRWTLVCDAARIALAELALPSDAEKGDV